MNNKQTEHHTTSTNAFDSFRYLRIACLFIVNGMYVACGVRKREQTTQ